MKDEGMAIDGDEITGGVGGQVSSDAAPVANPAPVKSKILTKNFVLIFGALMSCSLTLYTLLTIITEYATLFGASSVVAGLISGVYVVSSVFARLYAGRKLEKVSWKKFALFFMGFHFVVCCCYFLVNDIVSLFIVRMVHGIGFGAGSTAVLTMSVSVLPKDRFAEANGYLNISAPLATALGPLVGGFVYDTFGSTGCFLFAGLLSFGMFFFVLLLDVKGIEPTPEERERAAREKAEAVALGLVAPPKGIAKLLEVKALPMAVCTFLMALGYASIVSFHRLYGAETGLSAEFALLLPAYAALVLVARPVSGMIQDRFGDNVLFVPGIALQMVGLASVALAPCLLTVLLCAVGCALGYGMLSTCCNAIVVRNVSTERRSYAVSTFWMFSDGGMGLGPFIMGAFASLGGYGTMLIAAAVFTLVAFPVYAVSHWKDGKRPGVQRP